MFLSLKGSPIESIRFFRVFSFLNLSFYNNWLSSMFFKNNIFYISHSWFLVPFSPNEQHESVSASPHL